MASIKRYLSRRFPLVAIVAVLALVVFGGGERELDPSLALGLAAAATWPAAHALRGLFRDIRLLLRRWRGPTGGRHYLWLDSLPHGVVETDLRGRVRFCSAAARALLAEGGAEGRPAWALLEGEDAVRLREGLEALAEGRCERFDLTAALPGSGARLRFDWGRRRGAPALVALVSDVTEQERDRLRLEEAARRRAEDEITLRRKRDELQRLTLFLHSVREQEQRRISQELHDELGQLITAVRFDLDQLSRRLEGPEMEGRLSRLGGLIDEMVLALRRIARGLRPRLLDEVGLVAACLWLVEDFGQRSGLDCRFQPDRDEYDLAEPVATAVFRIVQEALTNVARHAQATTVQVRMRQSRGSLELEIEDDGCGMDVVEASSRGTYGLLGMRERAQMLGGQLSVSSAPSKGTRVTARIPLSLDNGGGKRPGLPL